MAIQRSPDILSAIEMSNNMEFRTHLLPQPVKEETTRMSNRRRHHGQYSGAAAKETRLVLISTRRQHPEPRTNVRDGT